MTPIQREHSKLHGKHPGWPRVLDGELSVATSAKDGHFSMPDGNDVPKTPEPSAQRVLEDLTCESDAVFVATVSSSVSNPIDDGTYLFTDYNVLVTEPIRFTKGNIGRNSTVVITRSGGRIVLPNGRTVETVDPSFPLLQVNKRYLLFTKFVPSTKAYRSAIETGTFAVDGRYSTPLVPLAAAADDLSSAGYPLETLIPLLRHASCR